MIIKLLTLRTGQKSTGDSLARYDNLAWSDILAQNLFRNLFSMLK